MVLPRENSIRLQLIREKFPKLERASLSTQAVAIAERSQSLRRANHLTRPSKES